MLLMLDAFRGTPRSHQAHALGTLYRENRDFRIKPEIGGDYEKNLALGNTEPGDGKRFIGRGGVQITGRNQYGRASRSLGVDFLNYPELAGHPKYWPKLAYEGLNGAFTAQPASSFLPAEGDATQTQFNNAIATINLNDPNAAVSAGASVIFQDALKAGGLKTTGARVERFRSPQKGEKWPDPQGPFAYVPGGLPYTPEGVLLVLDGESQGIPAPRRFEGAYSFRRPGVNAIGAVQTPPTGRARPPR